jgi:hypothetical protein
MAFSYVRVQCCRVLVSSRGFGWCVVRVGSGKEDWRIGILGAVSAQYLLLSCVELNTCILLVLSVRLSGYSTSLEVNAGHNFNASSQ